MIKNRVGLWVVLLTAAIVVSACAVSGGSAVEDNGVKGDGETESLSGGIIWRREGGIAGFCDVVTINVTGSATIAGCRTEPPEKVADVDLTPTQSALVTAWVTRLRDFRYEESDPATADAMTITIVFSGDGIGDASDSDFQEINTLAQELLRAAAGN